MMADAAGIDELSEREGWTDADIGGRFAPFS